MRKALVQLCLIIIAIIGIHTSRIMHSGSIHGKVYPANVADTVLAINGSDSVMAVSNNGRFGMKVEPGVWKVIVAFKKQPGANVIKDNLEVNEGQNVNLGEIRMVE